MTQRRNDELRQRRDHAAHALKMEPAPIAPRAALEAIATQHESADTLLVPWQRELLEVQRANSYRVTPS
jgi:spore cortex formation protein SpoVR/YcgB (stage V sporulation)